MERRGLACEPGEVAPMHKVVLALFLLWDGEDNTDAGSLKNLQSRRFHSPVVHFVVRHLCVCEYVGGWMCVCVCVWMREW